MSFTAATFAKFNLTKYASRVDQTPSEIIGRPERCLLFAPIDAFVQASDIWRVPSAHLSYPLSLSVVCTVQRILTTRDACIAGAEHPWGRTPEGDQDASLSSVATLAPFSTRGLLAGRTSGHRFSTVSWVGAVLRSARAQPTGLLPSSAAA
jgi:hypothetical protein